MVVHASSETAAKVATEAAGWLRSAGHAVDVAAHADAELAPDVVEMVSRADLVVSLGGDGTMLRAVETASPFSVPVLGVNLGTLGYLTAVEPHHLHAALESFVSGSYALEIRTTLEVAITGAVSTGVGGIDDPDPGRRVVFPAALNEAVLERSVPGHTVRIGVSIAGARFASYAADGLLVCSASGSTAYNLSARGPILSPRLDAVVVTPVSPHMLFDRALVLGPDENVDLEVLDPRPAVLVVDGIRVGTLGPGSRVEVAVGPHPARLVSVAARDFHGILKAKFHLADR